jgi:predicted transcriptional regulator of viral defense system
MREPAGLGKADRARLAAVIRSLRGAITVAETSNILQVSPADASKMLSRWVDKGWVSRIRRGLYVPIPLEALTSDATVDDPWIIADRLFAPCYIGGWSAAAHWGLTDQVFRTILVMTAGKPRDRTPVVKGTRFVLHTLSPGLMFGLKSVWRSGLKVSISDPSRTFLDMLSMPRTGAGIRSVIHILSAYMKGESKDLPLLMEYAEKLGNGAIFKRFGFLLDRFFPEEKEAMEACRSGLTAGNARMDPDIPSNRLITRWRLWIPPRLTRESEDD